MRTQSELASWLIIGIGFVFFAAITITWSAVGAGQDAVDLQASSAEQLSWAASELQDKAGAAEVSVVESRSTSDR